MRGRLPPEPEFYPDARRSRRAMRDLSHYRGMPVIIVYRPRSRDVRDPEHVILKGVVQGTRDNPPRLDIRIRGELFKLPLDRIASIELDIDV